MASYEVAESKHATFTGTTADLITFTIPWQVVRIINRDASDTVYFTCNSTTAPTAAVAGSHIVRAGESVVYASKAPIKYVYLVGDGGDYSVEGFPGFGSSASSAGGGSGTADTELPAAAALADNAATPTAPAVGAFGMLYDGATWDLARGTSTDGALVNLGSNNDVVLRPETSGGYSVFMASGADGSTALVATVQTIKASAGQLYGWFIHNPNAATSWIQIWNTASGSITVGTTNPFMTLGIPAASSANVFMPHGIAFSTAINIAATSTVGTNAAPSTGLDTVWFYA